MRRASIVAPLLLIGVGALLLARNVFPDIPLLDYLAKYWPFLLIIWGGLRLLEILFWAATSKPLPVQGVHGGEWVLVIFLCLLGASLHAIRGFSTWWPNYGITMGGLDIFGETYEYPVSAEKPASPTARIVIDNLRGNVRITGGDVTSVKVNGRTTIRSLDQASADRANQDSPLEVVGEGNTITIRSNQSRVSATRRPTTDLEITVPKGASIEARGQRGDFDINSINGSIDINSDNSSVRLEDIAGPVKLDVRGSDVIRAVKMKGPFEMKGRGSDVDLENVSGPVTISGSYSGTVQFRELAKPLHWIGLQTEFTVAAVPGQIRLTIPDMNADGITGPIQLNSRSKDIRLSNFTNSLDLTLDRGDIVLLPGTTPLPRITAHTRAGNVELALPNGAKYDLTASTVRGDVTNELGGPIKQESNGRRGEVLRGSNGGPAIDVSTDRGEVMVRAASAGENTQVLAAPPIPPAPRVPAKPPIQLEQ